MEVLLREQEPIPAFLPGKNRIDQRMPLESDHRLLSPFQIKRLARTGLKKTLFVVQPKKLAGNGQARGRCSDQAQHWPV